MTKAIRNLAVLVFILAILVGCAGGVAAPAPAAPSQQQEQRSLEQQQQVLIKNQPAPLMDYSLERENIAKRLTRFNDPNKLGYLYTLTENGQIIGFYVVKGKISSVNSYMTTSEQMICYGDQHGFSDSAYSDYGCLTTEAPDSDGSYGTNGEAIFWFDVNDVYGEWNGLYQYMDEPLDLSSPPLMTQDVTEEK